MPKNNKTKKELDESKILKLLMEDSRQTTHEIAKKLGFSRQKVWKTIKKLEKENVIWGYNTVIDENTIGRNSYFALLKGNGQFDEIIGSSAERLKMKNAEKMNIVVLACFYVHGVYDWIVIFSAENIMDAKKFCGYIQKEYGSILDHIDLLENVFTLLRFGKINPNLEKIKELAVS